MEACSSGFTQLHWHHLLSQSCNFLLPLGFVRGWFMPAILLLYFARRGSLFAQLHQSQRRTRHRSSFEMLGHGIATCSSCALDDDVCKI